MVGNGRENTYTPFTLATFHGFSLRLAIRSRTQGIRRYNAGTSAGIRERSAMKRGETQGSREKLNMFNLSLRLDVYIKMRKQSAERPRSIRTLRGAIADHPPTIFNTVSNVCAAYKQHCVVKLLLFYLRIMKKCQSESREEPKLSETHRNAMHPRASANDPRPYFIHYKALHASLAW